MKTKQKQPKKTVTLRSTIRKAPLKRVKRTPIHKTVKGHAKHVLVPHKANDYRPYLIRVQGIVSVLVIALLAQVTYSFVTTGRVSVLGRTSDITTVELLNDTNKEREKVGVSDLNLNAQLSDAAFLKAQNMLKEQYWAHTSPGGVQPWKWLGDVGYNYSYAGENLAKNYSTAQDAVDAWMNSPAHRENIVKGAYQDVGFAVVDGALNGQQTTLIVAFYGSPASGVQGSTSTVNHAAFSSPVSSGAIAPLSYFGSALGGLSPVTIAILCLLIVVAIIGAIAHHYRRKLPKAWQKSWRVHHGLYTFFGMMTLGVLVIVATGGGSI